MNAAILIIQTVCCVHKTYTKPCPDESISVHNCHPRHSVSRFRMSVYSSALSVLNALKQRTFSD